MIHTDFWSRLHRGGGRNLWFRGYPSTPWECIQKATKHTPWGMVPNMAAYCSTLGDLLGKGLIGGSQTTRSRLTFSKTYTHMPCYLEGFFESKNYKAMKSHKSRITSSILLNTYWWLIQPYKIRNQKNITAHVLYLKTWYQLLKESKPIYWFLTNRNLLIEL